MKLSVIYEDNHLLVVDKPSGILTQPSGTDQPSLEKFCKDHLKEKYAKKGEVYLHAVHRLDRPVSGLVVFAKTSKALSRMNASLRNKQAKKIYHALVEGVPKQSQGILENFLFHDSFSASVVDENHTQAKLAKLSFKVTKVENGNATLEIELETGRYHQIRVQLAHLGHPIVGDVKYGASGTTGGEIALRHVELTLVHPVKKEKCVFSCSF
ncbi:MAG: RluA family pseudouridine synthase [Chlamydiota bacterium]|nr:RluA family pseudouridine synthase [Chlamydiota bacterium]